MYVRVLIVLTKHCRVLENFFSMHFAHLTNGILFYVNKYYSVVHLQKKCQFTYFLK